MVCVECPAPGGIVNGSSGVNKLLVGFDPLRKISFTISHT